MQQFTDSVISELSKRNKNVIPVVEIYSRNTDDITSISAPGNAIGRFSNVCIDWTNSTGTYSYLAKVLEFPEISTYLDEEVNTAEVTFGNLERGENSMSRFVLNNRIKGCWMVIRLIFPDSPEDSVIVFWGKCMKPGEIDNKSLSISATQDVGSYTHDIPFREYQTNCPLDFARPLGGCLGDQTLEEKSPQYRQAFATYSTAGCNKIYTTCSLLGNTEYFQGQRVVAVSGQFSYITVEEVVKRVLFWTKRKKIRVVKTDNWSSVNQSEGSEVVPLAFGRCQIHGHPFTWADVGSQVRSLLGFCEGRISAFNFVRSRIQGINILSYTEHLGDWGDVGTQSLDILFNGVSGYNSRLAYLEVLTDGSSPTQVDDAPIITAVIKGLEIPLPNEEGVYGNYGWTNNPVHITRYALTDTRFGRIPANRIDDAVAIETALECDTIVEDRTNDEVIVIPSNEASNYGEGYRRFRSASRATALKEFINSMHPLAAFAYIQEYGLPEFEEPYVQWYDPFQPYLLPREEVILRQKYTFNGALQEKTSLLDFLSKRLLPTFKGYINYAYNGLIQIKTRKKADNTYLRMDTKHFDVKVPVSNSAPWRLDKTGYIIIGVSLESAELREVTGIEYSTACNGIPITGTDEGAITVTTSGTFSSGNKTSPAYAHIELSGTPEVGDTVEITIGEDENQIKVSYIADGVEDTATFATMLTAFLNAHTQFQSFLTAYILPSNRNKIIIRCETGYLNIDRPLEYEHFETEEVLRVQAVFENCGELTANTSARYDNISDDTFKWNTDTQEDINAVIATYTSAIDDFRLTKISPRAAWDTIDLEGELKTKELDLSFVDNYWQAAFLAKSDAIENIDGNVFFEFQTSMLAMRLELGDVVAVRHDSGDGVLNYIPVCITSVKPNLNDFLVLLQGKLYLSAAFDLHVQPIDVLLTTTLNPSETPTVNPPPIGTTGGISQSTMPNIPRPDHGYYEQFNISKYSPTGLDLV